MRRQRGAALLLAMLTVTLVATIAAAATWQQWQAVQTEQAERQRAQAAWILNGALDWARLILREDARGNQTSGNADHLGEPWAMPLAEARLSSFLAADRDSSADTVLQAFLSGEMLDQQSRLNLFNLLRVEGAGNAAQVSVSEPDLQAASRLYDLLGLPAAELTQAVSAWRDTVARGLAEAQPTATPLIPRRFGELSWLGISARSLQALAPHATLLPERTPVNLNTAGLEVLQAVLPGVDAARARQLMSTRERSPFKSLGDVSRALGENAPRLVETQHDVRSRYFEVRGRLRLDDVVIEERSLVVRDNLSLRVAWRERLARP